MDTTSSSSTFRTVNEWRSGFRRLPEVLTVEEIQRKVAEYFGVKLRTLLGEQRHRAVAHPRMVAMYLARRLTGLSYPQLGQLFGGRDHTTVISSVRKIDRCCQTDVATRTTVEVLLTRLPPPMG